MRGSAGRRLGKAYKENIDYYRAPGFHSVLAEVLTGVLIKGLAGVIPEDLQLPAYRLYFAGSLLAVGVVYGSKLLGFEIAGFLPTGRPGADFFQVCWRPLGL